MQSYFFLIIILGCGIYYFYTTYIKGTKKAYKNKKQQTEEDTNLLIDNVCRNINEHINTYNNILAEANIITTTKREEIINANDMDAMAELKIYTVEFQEQQELVSNRIEHIKRLLEEEHDFESAFKQNQMLKEEVDLFAHIIEKMKYIEIHRTNYSDAFKNTNFAKQQQPERELNFFSGCETKEEADKRYRNLSKAFHPDTGCGDTELFQKMTDEYNNLKF